MDEQSNTKKAKKRNRESKPQAEAKMQFVLEDLRNGKTSPYIIKKHQLTNWQIRYIKRKHILQQIKKGVHMEEISHQLNMRIDDIRGVRNDYINQRLKVKEPVASIAEKVQMEPKHILAIRNRTIVEKLLQKVSPRKIAHRWRLSENDVSRIRERSILKRLRDTHPEDIAKAFRLSVAEIASIRQKNVQPSEPNETLTKESKIWLKNIKEQEKEVLSRIERGETTRDIAKQLKMNQRIVNRTRIRHIEQAFERKEAIEEISRRFYTPKDELRKIRNQRILVYREEGIQSDTIARKFNMKIHTVQRVGFLNGVQKQPKKREKTYTKNDGKPLSSIPVDTYTKFKNELRAGRSMKEITKTLKLKPGKLYEIRNHLVLTKLNQGEKTEDVAKRFKTTVGNIYQITLHADLTKYPNIKRRTNGYLSEEQSKAVQGLIRAGKTNRQIANLLSVKETLVVSKRRSMKCKTRISDTKRRITDEQKLAILAERGRLDTAANSIKHGVSEKTVRVIESQNDEKRVKVINERKKDVEKLKKFKQIEQEIKRRSKIENIKRILQEKPQQFRSTKHTSLLQR